MHKKKLRLMKLPEILVIHLKRFEIGYFNNQKINA